jgi:hypothetical protein
MTIKRINDPFILNAKIELEGLRASLNYRVNLQNLYKKKFSECQRSKCGKSRLYSAMLNWNILYINKLLTSIKECKVILGELYESERKLVYLEKKREDSTQ